MSVVAEQPAFSVQRWTRTSVVSSGGLATLVGALVFVPVVLSANATDKLTTLYVYVILAVDKATPPNRSAPSARVEETAR